MGMEVAWRRLWRRNDGINCGGNHATVLPTSLPTYLPSRASTETRYLDSSGSINSFSSQVSIELRKCGDVVPAAVLPTKCVRKPDGQQGV